MAKYMIDHENKLIHRTAYVGDKCDLPKIQQRSGEKTDKNFASLKKKGYEFCTVCYDGPTID